MSLSFSSLPPSFLCEPLPRGCCWECGCWACCAQFPLPSSNWSRCQLEKWIETGNMTWVIELFWWTPSLIQSHLAATATALSGCILALGWAMTESLPAPGTAPGPLSASLANSMSGRLEACWHKTLLLFLLTLQTACLLYNHFSSNSKHFRFQTSTYWIQRATVVPRKVSRLWRVRVFTLLESSQVSLSVSLRLVEDTTLLAQRQRSSLNAAQQFLSCSQLSRHEAGRTGWMPVFTLGVFYLR